MPDQPGPRETLVLLARAALAEDLGFLAAAIAYYAFVSLIPLVILAVAVASIVGGANLVGVVTSTLTGVLTPEALALLEEAMATGQGRGGTTLVGLLVLAWGGLRFFRGLHAAFARIYGTRETGTAVHEFADAVVTLGALAGSLALLAGIIAVVTAIAPDVAPLAPLVTALLLPVAFYPLYYVLPDVDVAPREAVPGAVLAGLGWTVLGWVFAIYASQAGFVSIYGAIGVALLALTWFYAGALLILLGAVLNAVRAGRADNRQLQQVADRDDT